MVQLLSIKGEYYGKYNLYRSFGRQAGGHEKQKGKQKRRTEKLQRADCGNGQIQIPERNDFAGIPAVFKGKNKSHDPSLLRRSSGRHRDIQRYGTCAHEKRSGTGEDGSERTVA